MANSPKENEEKMLKVLNAWRTLAPDKTFAGMTLAQFEEMVNASLAPRRKLLELQDMMLSQQALRDANDELVLKKIEKIKAGVIESDEFGSDSALIEGMGYKRKSEYSSGLTRKKNNPEA